jgi:hypothetical protein
MTSSGTPVVSQALRSIVWSALKAHGFSSHTSRTAWRARDDTTDVVNVQAIVSKFKTRLYLGEQERGPAYAAFGSFCVNVGTYYAVRRVLPYKRSRYACPADIARPLEYQCDHRRRLTKSIAQNPVYPSDIWAVGEDGKRAEEAVRDALDAIEAQALSWFDENADLEAALVRLRGICWAHALDLERRPDVFFQNEDLFVALAIRVGRAREAIELLETIAAHPVDATESTAHAKAESKRLRRLGRSAKAVIVEPLPHWHDGAMARLQALRTFCARSGISGAG